MTNGLTNSSASTNPPINNQNKTLAANGVYTADSGYTGLGEVTVAVPPTQPVLTQLSASPSTVAQTFTPPQGYDGYDEVSVAAVTSAIDSNIASENIVAGTSILGVAGSATELNGTTLSVTPTTSVQNFVPVAPANGFTSVAVSGVTSSIDSNIKASNIKAGVTILNVTGTAPVAQSFTLSTAVNVSYATIPSGAIVGVWQDNRNGTDYRIMPLCDFGRLASFLAVPDRLTYYIGVTKESIAVNATGSVECYRLSPSGNNFNYKSLFCRSYSSGYLDDYAYGNSFISMKNDKLVFNTSPQSSYSNGGDIYVKNSQASGNQFQLKLTFQLGTAVASTNVGVLACGAKREQDIRDTFGGSSIGYERPFVLAVNNNELILEIRPTISGTESTKTIKWDAAALNVGQAYELILTKSASAISLYLRPVNGSDISPTSGATYYTNVESYGFGILAIEYPFIQDCGDFDFLLEDCYLNAMISSGNRYVTAFAGTLTY